MRQVLRYSRKPFVRSFVGFFSALTTWSGGEIYTHNFYKTVATSCRRLHNKAQYAPINLKHLMIWEIKSIYWATLKDAINLY